MALPSLVIVGKLMYKNDTLSVMQRKYRKALICEHDISGVMNMVKDMACQRVIDNEKSISKNEITDSFGVNIYFLGG